MKRTATGPSSVVFEGRKLAFKNGRTLSVTTVEPSQFQQRNVGLEEIGRQLKEGNSFNPKRYRPPVKGEGEQK